VGIDDDWKPEYAELSQEFLRRHFGWPPHLASTFPTMRTSYPWGDHRPPVVDSRVHAKNNTEYHGLETYAWQYHVTVQYREAYEHFLMAAAMRREDLIVMGVSDPGHDEAVRYCIRHALFNRALAEREFGPWPEPEDFGIDPVQHAQREAKAQAALDAAYADGRAQGSTR
jgi:hypothetical protein